MLVHRAAEHGDADPGGDLVAHFGQARARHQERHPHLGGLDHHLGGEAAGGVENLVGAVHAVEPHLPGDGVHGVVAADVLDEIENFRAGSERAAVHRARALVDCLVAPHGIEQGVERFLAKPDVIAELDGVDFLHQVAEDRALPAAGGDGALLELVLQSLYALASGDGDRVGFPVHLHGCDFLDRADQSLVAEVADGQRLRCLAKRHEGHNLALVDVERNRVLSRDRRGHGFAALVDRFDLERQRPAGAGNFRAVGRVHFSVNSEQ